MQDCHINNDIMMLQHTRAQDVNTKVVTKKKMLTQSLHRAVCKNAISTGF